MAKKSEITEFKHRILSNENVLYLYSEREKVLHEKHCPYVREIPDKELKWLKEYSPEIEQCPNCAAASYIHIGAKDSEDMDSYLSLFDKIQIPVHLIRSMYLERQMRTRIHRDTITVWYKNDVWKIRALSKEGHVQLYHNNYIIKNDGIREFT